MTNKANISCTKVIPLTGLLSPSPELNSIHKSGKLELPELKDHRNSLSNLVSRLGVPNIQREILEKPKLNSQILSEIANNFFTSSYSRKAEELVRTMSMPNYSFEIDKSNTVMDRTIPENSTPNPKQQEIIEQIKAMSSGFKPNMPESEPKKENENTKDFDSFF